MKKQVFHDAAAGVLIGLILSIIFSLIYAPNTYRPTESRVSHRPSDGSTSGSRCLGLALLHTYLGSYRYSLQLWKAIIQP